MHRFKVGDRVKIQPRYQMGGTYVHDNFTGFVGTIVKVVQGAPFDYEIDLDKVGEIYCCDRRVELCDLG